MAAITEFSIGLPDDWHVLPAFAENDAWAFELAGAILEGADTPIEEAVTLLGQQFLDVRRSVSDTGAANVRTAVLVSDPATALVDAMLTLSFERNVPLETYVARLDTVGSEAGAEQMSMSRQDFETKIETGDVRGAQFLIGHLPEDEAEATSLLEERVHLGLFPPGSTDFIELTVIAANPAFFEDITTAAVALVNGVKIKTEVTA